MNKKLCLSLVLITTISPSIAQNDTVQYPDEWYLYKEIAPMTCPYPINSYYEPDEFALDNYILPWSGIERVYGIALTMDTFHLPISTIPGRDSLLYAVAYRNLHLTNESDGFTRFELVNSTCLEKDTGLVRNCHFLYSFDHPDTNLPNTCFELYFDTPISLSPSDTIYLGMFSAAPKEWIKRYGASVPLEKNYGWLWNGDKLLSSTTSFGIEDTPIYSILAANGGELWGFAFPIVGFRCTVPKEVRLHTEADFTKSELRWQHHDEAVAYELQLADLTAHDTTYLTIAPTAGDTLALGHLDSTHFYHLHLRKYSRFTTSTYDTLVHSDWSPLLELDGRKVKDPSTGIDPIGLAGISLSPNPASGEAILRLPNSHEAGEVRLTDLDGRTLQKHALPADCAELTLPLVGLAAGCYMVHVATPPCHTAIKLIVE